MVQRVFEIVLLFVSLTAVLTVGLHGYVHSLTPLSKKAFPTDKELKLSTTFSQGLGVLGATMVTIGGFTYTSRRRFRAPWRLRKLPNWLESHIFLCLLCPVLEKFDRIRKTLRELEIASSLLQMANSQLVAIKRRSGPCEKTSSFLLVIDDSLSPCDRWIL